MNINFGEFFFVANSDKTGWFMNNHNLYGGYNIYF